MNNQLFIRNEMNPNEHRTPLIPKDISILIENSSLSSWMGKKWPDNYNFVCIDFKSKFLPRF